MEWKYTFDPVSRSEWMSTIQRDLKHISIDSLDTEYWPGEKITPFHYPPDNREIVSLPKSFFLHAPRIIEWFTIHDQLRDANRDILSSLAYGAQSLVFELDDQMTHRLQELLQDVYTDLIETSVILRDAALENHFSTVPGDIYLRVPIDAQILDQDTRLLKVFDPPTPNLRFTFSLESEGNWIQNVSSLFLHIKKLLSKFGNVMPSGEILEKCIILLESDQDYLKQIMQTRALQLVWLNFAKAVIGLDIHVSPIEVHISDSMLSHEKYLIKATSACMAASLTGVRGICLHPLKDTQTPGFHSRVLRNAHHLLDLESKMYRETDPLAGAYAIDHYSKKWATEILNTLGEF